jgi:hypothetical protein
MIRSSTTPAKARKDRLIVLAAMAILTTGATAGLIVALAGDFSSRWVPAIAGLALGSVWMIGSIAWDRRTGSNELPKKDSGWLKFGPVMAVAIVPVLQIASTPVQVFALGLLDGFLITFGIWFVRTVPGKLPSKA